MSDPFAAPRSAARPGRSIALVIGSGVATTALTLVVVHALEVDGVAVMGWYADYVLPVGALLVGICATSGYALGSWFGGRKVSGPLLGVVVALSLLAYVAAQYVDYRVSLASEGVPTDQLGFLAWFDLVTRAFSWEEHGRVGEPLGGWGYLLRLGEVSGFALGGLIGPAALRSRAYCDECLQYHRTRVVALVPAGAAPKGLLEKQDVRAPRQIEGQERGVRRLQALVAAAVARDWPAWAAAKAAAAADPGGAKPDKLHARIRVTLSFCRGCDAGFLAPALVSGHGRSITVQALPVVPLAPDQVGPLRS